MMRKTIPLAAMAATLLLAGCQSDGGAPSATPEEPTPTPSSSATAPVASPAGPAITLGDPDDAGVSLVTIDAAALAPAYFTFNEGNPNDPFFHIHTEESDLFVGIELYTMYGAGWTGQLGTFALDCTANGICVYLDVDGAGPAGALGPATTGQIVIDALSTDGYDVTLTGVTFPGYALADLTLVG